MGTHKYFEDLMLRPCDLTTETFKQKLLGVPFIGEVIKRLAKRDQLNVTKSDLAVTYKELKETDRDVFGQFMQGVTC